MKKRDRSRPPKRANVSVTGEAGVAERGETTTKCEIAAGSNEEPPHRSARVLQHGGFKYRLNKKSRSRAHYTCHRYNAKWPTGGGRMATRTCSARLSIDYSNGGIIVGERPHTHDAEVDNNDAGHEEKSASKARTEGHPRRDAIVDEDALSATPAKLFKHDGYTYRISHANHNQAYYTYVFLFAFNLLLLCALQLSLIQQSLAIGRRSIVASHV